MLYVQYEHMRRVDEATIRLTLSSSRTTWRTCTPAFIPAFTCARTLLNVPQVNCAIFMASDEQLRVAGHWRDARGQVTVIVTRMNGVHHLAGRVHEAHFNVLRFVDGHQPIADNRGTLGYKHDVHPIISITYNKHIRSARTPDSRCACRARALFCSQR